VQYSLVYNEETLAVYPFKFDFRVLYELIDNQLKVTYEVINKDDKDIYFSVGAHPAFNIPFYSGEKYEDYFIEFEQQESFNKFKLTPEGYLLEDTAPVEHEGNTIHLTKELFKDDALVFKNVASRKVTIRSKNHDQFLAVSFPHFKHLGIWAKYGADFVCIEPWLGYADTVGKRTEFKDKEAILKLEAGLVFETDMMIGF
jgi:galactose mutarotase-like enzyme